MHGSVCFLSANDRPRVVTEDIHTDFTRWHMVKGCGASFAEIHRITKIHRRSVKHCGMSDTALPFDCYRPTSHHQMHRIDPYVLPLEYGHVKNGGVGGEAPAVPLRSASPLTSAASHVARPGLRGAGSQTLMSARHNIKKYHRSSSSSS